MAHSRILRDQQGYLLISSSLVCVLIFTLLLSSSWIYWFLREKQTTQRLCYNHALKAQRVLIQTQEKVLALNKRAWRLIIEKKALDATIKAAPPKLKALALARKKMVVSQQQKLRLQQKSLLHFGDLKSRAIAFQLQKDIKKKLQQATMFWKEQAPQIHIQMDWKKTQIKPQFKEIAPPYKTVKNYKERQSIGLQWKMRWGKLLPKSWQSFTRVHSAWHGSCFSHPHKKGGRWFANIGPGKY